MVWIVLAACGRAPEGEEPEGFDAECASLCDPGDVERFEEDCGVDPAEIEQACVAACLDALAGADAACAACVLEGSDGWGEVVCAGGCLCDDSWSIADPAACGCG